MSIVYWALDYTIYGDYGYQNAAWALRSAAGAVFGHCSPQQNAVIAALSAVNLSADNCSAECNYQAVNISPSTANCNQGITLSAGCAGATNPSCINVTYSFGGPNVPFNSGTSSSINVTAPSTSGNYQYSLTMSKPNISCYSPTTNFNVNVNCGSTPNCDFSSGPRYVGTWNELTVQIRSISGKNVLVTAIIGASVDKYYPRGDNFWGSFNLDPNAADLQGCLNTGATGWGGLAFPGGISPPSGYQQDGAVFFSTNGARVGAPGATLEEEVALVHVRPNPAQDEVTVTFRLKAAGSVEVRLLDLQGRMRQQQTYQGVAGPNERVLRTGSLVTGIYALEVSFQGQRMTHKLVKE